MRKIFPDSKATEQLFNQKDDRATKQDIVDLSNQIEEVDTKVDSTQAELDAYKATIQTSVNTESITADSANIDEITSENVDTDNIDADTAAIGSLHTTGISTNGITSNTATIGNAEITDLQGTNANIGEVDTTTLKATNAEIDNLTVNTTNLTNVVAMQGVTTSDLTATGNTTVKDVTAEDISADNLTLTEKITSEEGEIDDLITEEHKVENIVWNGKQTMAGLPNTFYVEVPHFENGVYAFKIVQNDVAKLAVEIHNSIDNYFVRWSQEESGWITRIIKSGNEHASVLIFEVNNLTGAGSVLVYGTASGTENVPGTNMTASLTKPIDVNYVIPYKDGNKFFKNIDLANQGVTVGALRKSTSSLHSLATKNYIYDTTEPVNDIDYLPDQSVNTGDNVKFRTVDSTFLDVADMEVYNTLKSPHIMDGPVSDPSTLEDGSLFFPASTEQVNAGGSVNIGLAIASDTFGDGVTEDLHPLSSTLPNNVDNITLENTTYKPQDGYEFDRASPVFTCVPYWTDQNDLDTCNFYNTSGKRTWNQWQTEGPASNNPYPADSNDEGGYHNFGIAYQVSTGNYCVLFRPDDRVGSHVLARTVIMVGPLSDIYLDSNGFNFHKENWKKTRAYTNSALSDYAAYVSDWGYRSGGSHIVPVGSSFWDADGLEYILLYSQVRFYSYNDTIFIRNLGGTGAVCRKTTKDNTTQVLPLTPYQEVSTQATPVDDTHPIVYDTANDVLKKSTGDITVDNDLAVGNDLSVTGDANITGDASVTGDLSVNGDSTLKDTTVDKLVVNDDAVIHGDLYVDGTTHTTTEEQINTTADMFVLRQNNNTSLGSSYAGIVVNKYNGTEDLALVTDADGTMRVGTGTGTNTTYANIYWDDDTEKWYSDAALTTEVTPVGTLTSWESLEHLGDVKHYTNAVFTQITFNGIVPLLARDEEANMANRGILNWDSTTLQAKTTAAPTADGQVLVNKAGSAAFDKHLITIDGVQYEEYPTTPFTGTIPTGAIQTADTVTLSTQGTLYWSDSENAYYQEYEDIEHNTRWQKLNAFVYYAQDDEWNDGSTTVPAGNVPADIVAATPPLAYHYTKAAVAADYEWKDIVTPIENQIAAIPHTFVFNSYNDYDAVASTVPNGSEVVILNEHDYIIGDVIS